MPPRPPLVHRLLVELISDLQARQAASHSARAALAVIEQRDAASAARGAQLSHRLDRLEQQLAHLDTQLDGLRHTLALAFPQAAPPAAAPRAEVLLRVEGLSKDIGGAAILHDISFDIRRGEILGLIGPNGAGKTTLLECLAALRPRGGGAFFIGDDTPPEWDPRELLFYLPNGVLPYGELSTFEVLRFFGHLHEVEPPEWQHIVFDQLSLGPVLAKRMSTLSKGNLQRVLIAIALMSPQPLLALDEPFDGLDLHQTGAMMDILRGLRQQGRTLLLCIHQLNDAERICDRFVLLAAGRLVGVGSLADLRARTELPDASLEDIFLALT